MDLFNQLISTKIYESKDNTYSEKFPSENFTNFNEPKNYINK